MAAYDQVLAKLGKVGASVPQAGTKKRKEAEAEDEAEAAEGPAEPQKKKKKKKERKSSSAQEPSLEAAAVSSAEGGMQTGVLAAAGGAATADEVLTTTPAKAAEALSRSSHLARFGRRRAGKNVRRCGEVLVGHLYEMSVIALQCAHGSSHSANHVVYAATLDQTLRQSLGEAAARPQHQRLQSSQRLAHSLLLLMRLQLQQPAPWMSK